MRLRLTLADAAEHTVRSSREIVDAVTQLDLTLGMSCRGSDLGVASSLSKHSPAPGQLRVLIEQRSGEVRNMLQLEELLSHCNEPQHPDSDLDFSCRQFTFTGDLKR